MKHVFDKPVTFEGTEYTELEMNLDSLTGKDISQAKRLWAGAGNFSPVPAADMDFCAALAAQASKQPLEFFEALPAKEYTKLTQAVSNFLLS
jgi:hypothetical protein